MADDVLVEKLFNFICGSGGFVELSVLLRRSSPLGSRKTETEARNWLKNQTEFVLVRDGDGHITGVRIDLKKKICSQYVSKGSCRKRNGFCKHWHICKMFVEGNCDGISCGLSHDFHNEANGEMTRELELEKYSNGSLKNIVAWSLPRVCESYLRNECKSDKCPHIHICSKVVRGSSCSCFLSHNLTDSHNMRILKHYDLVPPSRVVNVEFVRCSILVRGEELCFDKLNSFNEGANGVTSKATTATVTSNMQTAATVTGKTSTANDANGKTTAENETTSKAKTAATVTSNSHSVNAMTDQTETTAANAVTSKSSTGNDVTRKSTKENCVTTVTGNNKPPTGNAAASNTMTTNALTTKIAAATAVYTSKTAKAVAATTNPDSPAKSRLNICGSASVLFNRLCKEFNCSAALVVLQKKQVVLSNELKDFLSILEENREKFLVVRNESGNVQEIIAFCPKLRLCPNFVSLNECKKASCSDFHLCRKFVTGTCKHRDRCSRSHSFRNQRDHKTLLQLDLDGLTNEQLRQLMLSSSPQVCIDYNKGKCTLGSCCPRVHICKNYVTNTCVNERRCLLDHKPALDTQHTHSLLDKYMLDSTTRNNALKVILVCEEQGKSCSAGTKLAHKEDVTGVRSKSAAALTQETIEENSDKLQTVTTTTVTATNTVTSKAATTTATLRETAESKPPTAIAVADKSTSSPAFAAKALSDNADSSKTAAETTVTSKTAAVNAVTRKTGRANSLKLAPSKSAVFECICKEYDGSVSFALISKRPDLLPGNSEDISAWFREQKERFLLSEDTDGTILQVSAFCPRARLCFDYLFSQSCSREDCQYFHVCREYIAGCCRFGSRCKFHHTFQFDEERKFISKLELDGLTHEELRKVLQLSMPQVCADYNQGYCAKGSSCSQIHICKNFVKKKCDDEDDCALQHENALLTSHSTNVLVNYDLRCTDGNFKFVLKELLVCDDSSRRFKERRSNSISQPNTDLKVKRGTSVDYSSSQHQVTSVSKKHSLPLADDTEQGFSSIKSSVAARIPCFPSERQVFESLCTEYDCSASFTAIGRRKDLFPHGLDSAESWFRRTKGSFLFTESDVGAISEVQAFSKEARLCLDYIAGGTCHKGNCQYLHVCKHYITGCCSSGAACPMNHHFHNGRDKPLLSRIKLHMLTEEQLRKLVQLSSPQVCVEYNNGACTRGNSCLKIHICCGYLRKNCRGTYDCGLEHEGALKTSLAQGILQRLQMISISDNYMLKLILDDNRSFSSRDKTKCRIHLDSPNTPICLDFLLGNCPQGGRCLKHHCSLPYHWQYKVPNLDVWKSFSDKDNVTLEKLYCDVNVETRVNFNPAETLDFSLPKSEQVSLLGEGCAVTIDLDDMLMFLRPQISRDTSISQLRRLSTVDCIADPCNVASMSWLWYWKEKGNVWRTYDKDNMGRDLQGLIEQAYQDMLTQGRARKQFKFATSEHQYNLFFSSTGMYQVNLKTGTKRAVKRRPGKVISSEDMEDLKWQYGDDSVRDEIRTSLAKNKYFLSHWSSMPPNAKYFRADLECHSAEFKHVEQSFRRSMNDYVRIIRIDRVQNLFMMEKYCRKKENMMVTAKCTPLSLNEKQLFHGTSPDAVTAICKHNFDWRLHGKNATAYGEGTYFAKNASYSHAYAKKEDLTGFQYIFLAKVLVGTYTTGHSSYRRPPPKNPSDPASDLYDSCVNNQSSPTIFVVFDTDQCYPEYLIKYSTEAPTTSSSTYHALPQPTSAAPARPKTTSSLSTPGTQRKPASLTYPAGKSSYPNAVLPGHAPTSVKPTAKVQLPHTHAISASNSSGGILRNANISTVSANKPRRPLGTTPNVPGPSTGSDFSSTAISSRRNLARPPNSSNHPASTTSTSGSTSRGGYSSAALNTAAPRSSTPSSTASSQSASTAQSGYYTTAFGSSYVVVPFNTSKTAAPNTGQTSGVSTPYASATVPTRTTDTSTFSSASYRRPFTDTSANMFPQQKKKKEKCLIS